MHTNKNGTSPWKAFQGLKLADLGTVMLYVARVGGQPLIAVERAQNRVRSEMAPQIVLRGAGVFRGAPACVEEGCDRFREGRETGSGLQHVGGAIDPAGHGSGSDLL